MDDVANDKRRRQSDPVALADEADFVHRLRGRERAAEREFYQRFRRPVAANVYRVLGDADELDDLVQEVFVIAFRGIDKFRGESRLSTWLYRISVNVALGRIRSRSRKPRPVLLADGPSRDEATTVPSPAQRVAARQDRELCYRLLDQLSPKKRAVLYLHEFEGHDLREIATIVGANPVTIRTRLYYARREFFRLAETALAERRREVER